MSFENWKGMTLLRSKITDILYNVFLYTYIQRKGDL